MKPKNFIWKRLATSLGPFIGLILVLAIFSLMPEISDRFLRLANIKSVVTQSVMVALCALGMTFIIVTGGIDLSAASNLALSCVLVAFSINLGLPPWLAALAGLATGGLVGFFNGFLITRLKVVPFIVTLGMMGMARGAAKWVAKNQKIDAPLTWLNELMTRNPRPGWLLVSPGIWLVIILSILMAILLKRLSSGVRFRLSVQMNSRPDYAGSGPTGPKL